jgi:uncharacterized membrane protein
MRPRAGPLIVKAIVIAAAFAAGALGARLLRGWDAYHRQQGENPGCVCRAAVQDILGPRDGLLQARVRVVSGEHRGKTVPVVQTLDQRQRHGPAREGERRLVVLRRRDGKLMGSLGPFERESLLLGLAAAVTALLVLTAGRNGLAAAGAVAWALVLILAVLLPATHGGARPDLWCVPLALAIAGPTLLAIGGWNRKSLGAIGGALCGVVASGLVGVGFARAMALTGVEVEFGAYAHLDSLLWFAPGLSRVDYRGLLVAGMVLAGLGAVMDVSMAVASTVAQVRQTRPGAGLRRLFRAGMGAGRDILGVMVFTLGMVFVGAHLVLFVTAARTDWVQQWIHLANYEELAAELARLAAAGLGMALCVPAAAFLTALLHREAAPSSEDAEAGQPTVGSRRPAGGALRRVLWPVAAGLACLAAAGLADEWALRTACSSRPDGGGQTVAQVRDSDPPVLEPTARGLGPHARGMYHTQLAVVVPCFGPHAGEELASRLVIGPTPGSRLPLRRGAMVRASVKEDEPRALLHRPPLRYRWGLVALLVVAATVMLAAGTVGLRVLGVFAGAGGVLLGGLVPALAAGWPPLVTTGAACVVLLTAVFAVSGRMDRKALAALVGCVAGLGTAAALVLLAGWRLGFRGLDSVPAQFLASVQVQGGGGLDFLGLLEATLLVALFGLALDTAVTVAAGVAQVCAAQPGISRSRAAAAGMGLSRDVVGTMVLTLVFAFVGLRLAVFLLPPAVEASPAELVNAEAGAMAILHVLVGAVALTVTGPVTAWVAGALLTTGARPAETEAASGAPSRRWPKLLAALLALAACGGLARWWHLRRARLSAVSRVALPGEPQDALAVARQTPGAEGRLGETLRTLWAARRRAPGDPRIHRELARIAVARHWLPQARRDIGAALDAGADDAETHYVAGVIYAWLEEDDVAEQHLRRAVVLDPHHAPARAALERLFGP